MGGGSHLGLPAWFSRSEKEAEFPSARNRVVPCFETHLRAAMLGFFQENGHAGMKYETTLAWYAYLNFAAGGHNQ